MQKLSIRINMLMSKMNAKLETMVRSMCECNETESAILILTKRLSCTLSEAEQCIHFVVNNKNQINNKSKQNEKQYHKLTEKSNKIMNMQTKLKEINKFKYRENCGEVAILQLDIGREINELELDHLDAITIDNLSDNIVGIKNKIDDTIEDLDSAKKLLEMNVRDFCKQIDNENKRKKEALAQKLKSKQKENKKQRIANNKSHKINTKYSELIECEDLHFEITQRLKKAAKTLQDTAKALGIFNENNKCPQESRWKNAVNNDEIVTFKGQKAFNRIKNMLKEINCLKKKVNDNQNTLKELMNGAIWRKEGRLKSKKTMRERADTYKNEKIRRKTKNEKTNKEKKENKKQKKKRDYDTIRLNANEVSEPPKKKQKTIHNFFANDKSI